MSSLNEEIFCNQWPNSIALYFYALQFNCNVAVSALLYRKRGKEEDRHIYLYKNELVEVLFYQSQFLREIERKRANSVFHSWNQRARAREGWRERAENTCDCSLRSIQNREKNEQKRNDICVIYVVYCKLKHKIYNTRQIEKHKFRSLSEND